MTCLCWGGVEQARGEGDVDGLGAGVEGAEGHEGAGDEDVIEGAAGVFAPADGGMVCVVNDSDHELQRRVRGKGAGVEAEVKACGGGVHLLDMEIDAGGGGLAGERVGERGGVAADELLAAVDDHLRGIGAGDAEAGGIVIFAGRL